MQLLDVKRRPAETFYTYPSLNIHTTVMWSFRPIALALALSLSLSAQNYSGSDNRNSPVGGRSAAPPAVVYTLPSDQVSVRQLAKKPSARAMRDVKNGIELSDLGQHEKALKLLQRAVHDSPDYFMAHNWLGVEYNALHQFPEAIAEFQRLVELDPGSPIGFANLAVLAYNAGHYDESEQISRRALQVRDGFNLAQFVLAQSLLRQGREVEQARRLLFSASRTIPAAAAALQVMDARR